MPASLLLWVSPREDLHLGGGVETRKAVGLAKLQPQRLLALQLADDAVVDGQPVHAGHQQLAGQQAALVYQRLIWLLGVALVPSWKGEGDTWVKARYTYRLM